MAEKVVSPGVFTNEIDQSFLPAAIGDIGAAVIGPTVKGPAMVPTVVSSYSEFQEKFGDSFKSGSQYYSYLTSTTAEQYLKHSGKLTVVRIMSGSFSGASASVITGSGAYFTGSAAAGDTETTGEYGNVSFKLNTHSQGALLNNKDARGSIGKDNIVSLRNNLYRL